MFQFGLVKGSPTFEIIRYCTHEVGEPQVKDELLTTRGGIDRTYPSTILTPTYLTGWQIDELLQESSLTGLGFAFAQAENDTGINSLFLVSIAAYESGWGTSYQATKYHNLFGFGGSRPVKFKSKESCIQYVAEFLRKEYLHSDGKYFRGYEIKDVNVKYCSNPDWTHNVQSIFKELTNMEIPRD